MEPPLHVRESGRLGEWEGPFEGVPSWLHASLLRWTLRGFYWDSERRGRIWFTNRLLQFERFIRGNLDWSQQDSSAVKSLEGLTRDGETFLSMVDFVLHGVDENGSWVDEEEVDELNQMLDESGSVWRAIVRNNVGRLERRSSLLSSERAESLMRRGTRPDQLLADAWTSIYGRNPNPGHGYGEAIRAVEAAAQPIIEPANQQATLGTIIRAIENTPNKWQITIKPKGYAASDGLVAMMKTIWKAQLDRHGTGDETVPLNVSLQEAEPALHVAVTLVHWFTTGVVSRVP